MEGLKIADAELMVNIHPSKCRNEFKAICRELSSLLFQYDETFDGVLLAYDFAVKSKEATILAGLNPYFGVKVESKLLLFNPKLNSLVEGKIVKISPESIHVIVLGFSTAVITDVDIREEFKYKMTNGEGCFVSRSHKRHILKVGTMLRLQVESFDEEVMHIVGSLLPANTGCVKWLEKQSEEALHMDRDHKGKSPEKNSQKYTKLKKHIDQ